MALCNDGHGSARRHRDLNGGGERFEFPRGSRPQGTPGGCVTELLLGLKTPLVEKGQRPLCMHSLKAAQQELSKSSCLLDLPEHRLHDLLSQSVPAAITGALHLLPTFF